MSCGASIWFEGNSHVVELTGLTNGLTGTLVSSGVTVSASIIPLGGGTAIAGSTISLAAVSGQPGTWRGTFPATIVLDPALDYQVVLVVDGGALLRGRWVLPLPVTPRAA